MEEHWWVTIFRGLFAGLNYSIYSVVEWIMQSIFDLASIELNTGMVKDIYMKIYVFLGIFMTFKLIISLLQYMVNPESLTDKEKGASKLVSRTVTMLVLLILLPLLFPLLSRIQSEFVPVLPKIILNQPLDNSDTVHDNADLIATSALGAFFRPSESLSPEDRPPAITSINDMMDKYSDHKNGIYTYDFNYVWALIAGVVICIILISMVLKIGMRVFKMFILEMIAPIPIISYIDPKSSKNGAFAAWTKLLISTFFDIFIRLGIVYFMLLILSSLARNELFDPGTFPNNPILFVIFIIALLMFAKDAPNFVKDALGIKHDKDTSGGLAAITGAVTGGATGLVSGAISGRGLRGAMTGLATGINTGWQGGMTGKKASAWSTAGDAALQSRTGDSKAKSGILNAVQKSATQAQLRRSARKLNLNDDTLAKAKDNMIAMQALAAEAEHRFQAGMTTGDFTDLQGNSITRDEALQIVTKTQAASTIATKNYEKANKAGDTYGLSRSFAGDYKKDMKDAKQDYKDGIITRDQYKAKGKFNPEKGQVDRTVR